MIKIVQRETMKTKLLDHFYAKNGLIERKVLLFGIIPLFSKVYEYTTYDND